LAERCLHYVWVKGCKAVLCEGERERERAVKFNILQTVKSVLFRPQKIRRPVTSVAVNKAVLTHKLKEGSVHVYTVHCTLHTLDCMRTFYGALMIRPPLV
jgi:hypothetical protein